MNINTKFNVDDRVYTIDFSTRKLKQGYISKIIINVIPGDINGFAYTDIKYIIGEDQNNIFKEDVLFDNADDACASLKNEIGWIQ